MAINFHVIFVNIKFCELALFRDDKRSRTVRRRRFGDADSATPFRRQDVLAIANSAMGLFGDRTFRRRTFRRLGRFGDGFFGDRMFRRCQFGDGTVRRQTIRRWDVLATPLRRFFEPKKTICMSQLYMAYGMQLQVQINTLTAKP